MAILDLQEDQSESPDLRIHPRGRPSFDFKLAGFCIVAITIDATKQELNFVRLEETPSWLLRNLFWKIDHEDVAEKTDADGQNAFEDEDPPPAVVSCRASLMIQSVTAERNNGDYDAYHLLDSVSKDSR